MDILRSRDLTGEISWRKQLEQGTAPAAHEQSQPPSPLPDPGEWENCLGSVHEPRVAEITEWFGLGRTLKLIPMGRDTFCYPRLLQALSRLALDTPRAAAKLLLDHAQAGRVQGRRGAGNTNN